MTIGERIRERRLELGMSQEELALKSGYKSRSSINKIELSRNLPLSKIEKLAHALNVTPGYLMGWEEEEETYYLDNETAKVANEIFQKDKILFDVYRSENKERLIEFARKLAELEEMERNM